LTLIVSDNSPLNVLIRIDCQDILPKLFDQILIPPEVAEEMAHPAAPAVIQEFVRHLPPWLSIQSPTRILPLPGLDLGERAAISLAIEIKAPLLIDELSGRRIAKAQGVDVVGAVGVLERAADVGLIVDLATAHQNIRSLNFHIGEDVLSQSLARHLAGKQ
jgi:predicted nucleic acid-binding protein